MPTGSGECSTAATRRCGLALPRSEAIHHSWARGEEGPLPTNHLDLFRLDLAIKHILPHTLNPLEDADDLDLIAVLQVGVAPGKDGDGFPAGIGELKGGVRIAAPGGGGSGEGRS